MASTYSPDTAQRQNEATRQMAALKSDPAPYTEQLRALRG
jgi:hypothetical protein